MEQSPPPIFVQNPNASYGSSYRSSSPFSSHTSSMPFPRSSTKPMSIKNSRVHDAPPPLPPPKHPPYEINAENDPGWEWQNQHNRSRVHPGSRPISPTNQDDDHMDLDEGYGESRRQDTGLRFKDSLSSGSYLKDEGYHSLSSSSLAHRYLQGERPLAQRNSQDASHAYDRNLLLRIGKPKSPPRSSLSEGMDSSPTSQSRFLQSGKPPHQLKQLSLTDRSLSVSSESPFKAESPFSARWTNSPQSAVVSPGLISSAANAESFLNYRSPTYSSASVAGSGRNGSSFSGNRSDDFAWRRQQHGLVRRCDSDGAILTNSFEDGANASSFGHGKRTSIDQSTLASDLDDDFPIEETGGMRHLHLDDRMSTGPDATHSPDSRLGTKRKASSPVRELNNNPDSADDKATQLHHAVGGTSNDSCQRRTSGHLSTSRASPVQRYHPQHGSVSSTSSGGLRTGSYASSAALSVGGSSITSFSSHDRHSPGGISPLSEYHDGRDSPYVNNNTSLDQSPRGSLSRPHQRLPSETKSAAAIARKMSTNNIPQGNQNNGPQLQSNIHICDCCPKKPKKFDTLEELHNHQLEKQYTCQFCHNRFKNKNEAERHQNSLHLRRHSWSCATLNNSYASAFHPSTAIPSTPNANHAQLASGAPSAEDICGYCGMHFTNNPPDWDARVTHLNQVHKFGECNQSKKFFRADHFRQHLKHSHAGTSGKWTNMLESACMKDEPQPPPMTPEALSHEQVRMAQQASAMTPMSPAGMPQPGAPVANMMGSPSGSRQGTFQQQMQMGMAGNNELQYQKIEEELPEQI